MRLLLWVALSFIPSILSLALRLKNKMLVSTRVELIIYGIIEIASVCSIFAIIAYEARVMPKAKDPVLPTNIFPLKL